MLRTSPPLYDYRRTARRHVERTDVRGRRLDLATTVGPARGLFGRRGTYRDVEVRAGLRFWVVRVDDHLNVLGCETGVAS